ncbi:hypothetical protein KR222_011672 [Zaprionus bogoriensis]|nr:hypothetical protein KR222_011672 [Zaprionus bogoriensis]
MLKPIADSNRCLRHTLAIYLLIFAGINQLNEAGATTPDLEQIPQLCDAVQCPADADMQCPEDSAIREIREINAVDLISSNSVGSTTAAPTSAVGSTLNAREGDGSGSSSGMNSYSNSSELYAQCCLAKKCVCKTCYIPSCSEEEQEVVVELVPEAMDTPGECCGEYECRREPNCTEVWDTDYFWLQSCQRCSCNSGARICQQSCDEANANAICESKSLNQFFKDGDSWVDGCYQCECVRGEQKCVIPFCGNVNCPRERQVDLKDSCCPVCWPKGEPMPHEKPRNYDDGYGYQREREQEPKQGTELDTSTTDSSSSTTTPATPATAEDTLSKLSEAPASSTSRSVAPCQQHDFPNVVEVVHPSSHFNDNVYNAVIVVLAIIIALMSFYIRHLLAKQRSYRPVSNFDDKV